MDDRYIKRHLSRLMLDANNYRFIDSKDYKQVEEAEISNPKIQQRTYNLLVGKNEENIADLIISFKANGVLKLDPIQVRLLPDERNYLVVEGNRRTAALKYLEEQSKKGNDIGKLTADSFKSLDLVLISDESPVQHLITMGLHHISGKKRWNPVNQAQLIRDLKILHGLQEEEICNSLSITRHNFRRSLRVLALIDKYKASDYGDQFYPNMYSLFEEIIKKVEMKKWLTWNDDTYQAENKVNEEKIFSWISTEEVIERNEVGDEQVIVQAPIITKSHEIREIAAFINDPKAVEQMEKSRSISEGFIFSDTVGEARLRNSMENISKEVQTTFQFSDYMEDEDYVKIKKLIDKLDRLIPTSKALVGLSEKEFSADFGPIVQHFSAIQVKQYRKLYDVKINRLKRVNIFVGGNNSGKTSLLELFYLMTRLNNISALVDMEKYRGRFEKEFHTKWFDTIFAENIELEAVFNSTNCSLSISKHETTEKIDKSHYLNSITADANVNGDNFASTIHLFSDKEPELYFQKSRFLCEATFSSPYRYNGVLLKKAHAKAIKEKYFHEILEFIREKMDNSIEKIEMVSIENESRFMVTSSHFSRAIDITKYGEGLQRVFEIALLMGYSRNGIICIDEVDSAIHKNLLIEFTQFIQYTAEKFNVQVFLSTHSKECIDAFVKNEHPDNELIAYTLSEVDGKVVPRFLEGNKLKQLVTSIDIDIR